MATSTDRLSEPPRDTHADDVLPENREYANPADQQVDDAVAEAIEAAEAADAGQLAEEFRMQLGYFHVIRGE